MTKQADRKVNQASEKILAAYCERYAANRPFNSAEKPALLVATMSGTGREVYNRDGGSTIAVFTDTESARKAIHKLTGIWC